MDLAWTKVLASTSSHEIQVAKAMLESHNVRCMVLDKQDSMYTSFNTVIENELLVPREEVIRAKYILDSKTR
ncbi:MAG: DUF2007 domain-containing protein [Bacteroidota bacterium]